MARNQAEPRKIRRLAQHHPYQIGPLEKAVRLAALLAELADDPFLANRLVLKGGTALNLYHGRLDRLSADADLNYVGQVDRAAMEGERAAVYARIEALAQELGYSVAIDLDDPAARVHLLRYTAANGNNDLIKVDLNMLERAPILVPVERRPPPPALEIDGPPVACLQLTELAGSKLATLLLRGACRDLFDVAALSKRTDIDWTLARKIALFHGFLDHVGLETMRLDRATSITQADFDRDLRNLVRKGDSVSLDELKGAALPLAEALVRLDDAEKAFLVELGNGRWEPLLLFGDLPFNPDMARHPGMEWRLRNPHARLPR